MLFLGFALAFGATIVDATTGVSLDLDGHGACVLVPAESRSYEPCVAVYGSEESLALAVRAVEAAQAAAVRAIVPMEEGDASVDLVVTRLPRAERLPWTPADVEAYVLQMSTQTTPLRFSDGALARQTMHEDGSQWIYVVQHGLGREMHFRTVMSGDLLVHFSVSGLREDGPALAQLGEQLAAKLSVPVSTAEPPSDIEDSVAFKVGYYGAGLPVALGMALFPVWIAMKLFGWWARE
ncbi:MAG: hypothetical protein KC912_09560 [Proteobacteria bacterium]|nr:hypothetical protein [Pseudomonadota bacterium]